jgi:hypothetical protein
MHCLAAVLLAAGEGGVGHLPGLLCPALDLGAVSSRACCSRAAPLIKQGVMHQSAAGPTQAAYDGACTFSLQAALPPGLLAS